MKLNCWIAPLLAVIFLIALRQMIYDKMEKKQQPAIPAVMEKKKQEVIPPMAGTRFNRDTALLINSAQ